MQNYIFRNPTNPNVSTNVQHDIKPFICSTCLNQGNFQYFNTDVVAQTFRFQFEQANKVIHSLKLQNFQNIQRAQKKFFQNQFQIQALKNQRYHLINKLCQKQKEFYDKLKKSIQFFNQRIRNDQIKFKSQIQKVAKKNDETIKDLKKKVYNSQEICKNQQKDLELILYKNYKQHSEIIENLNIFYEKQRKNEKQQRQTIFQDNQKQDRINKKFGQKQGDDSQIFERLQKIVFKNKESLQYSEKVRRLNKKLEQSLKQQDNLKHQLEIYKVDLQKEREQNIYLQGKIKNLQFIISRQQKEMDGYEKQRTQLRKQIQNLKRQILKMRQELANRIKYAQKQEHKIKEK